MALNDPPIQEVTTDKATGLFPQVWLRWFLSVFDEANTGFTGSYINNNGDTVTIINGKITDIS